jgi:hypothetical protein
MFMLCLALIVFMGCTGLLGRDKYWQGKASFLDRVPPPMAMGGHALSRDGNKRRKCMHGVWQLHSLHLRLW